ncbi:TOMM system kinase/cyclase fusion protein [compost metagenome]
MLRGEVQVAYELAQALVALATDYGLPYGLAFGTILSGWALAEKGNPAEGIDLIRQGLDAYRATGAEVMRTRFLILLAEACGSAGQAATGLESLAEALALTEQSGERLYEAEVHRVKGKLMLVEANWDGEASEAATRAQDCFLLAIEIARRQAARSLELRAVVALSRIWHKQGRHAEARELLSGSYGGFSEGFDTTDVREAGALLSRWQRA